MVSSGWLAFAFIVGWGCGEYFAKRSMTRYFKEREEDSEV